MATNNQFHKYYYRIEASDPVMGFIIDWDDGEDNSPEKANRQTIILDTPKYYAINTIGLAGQQDALTTSNYTDTVPPCLGKTERAVDMPRALPQT